MIFSMQGTQSLNRRLFIRHFAGLGATAAMANSWLIRSSTLPHSQISLKWFLDPCFRKSAAMAQYMEGYLQRFARYLHEETGGELHLTAAESSHLADFSVQPTLIHWQTLPATRLLSVLLPGESAHQRLTRLQSLEVEKAWADLYKSLGLKPLLFGMGTIESGHVSLRYFDSLRALNGAKSCSLSPEPSWLDNLGVRFCPLKDVRLLSHQLKTGSIDVTPALQHSVHDFLGNYRYGAFYYADGWSRAVNPYELVFQHPVWSRLGSDLQKVVRHASARVAIEMKNEKAEKERLALQSIAERGRLKMVAWPENLRAEFSHRSAEACSGLSRAGGATLNLAQTLKKS